MIETQTIVSLGVHRSSLTSQALSSSTAQMNVKVLCGVLALSISASVAVDLYVSPEGDDGNPGTSEKPFRTIPRAQIEVRSLKSAGESNGGIKVWLSDGTYVIKEPLVFRPEDSGSQASPITYSALRSGKATLSGGTRISGWRKQEGDLWTADIPEVKSGDWHFNELYVNGERRPRARIPNEGFLRVAGCPEGTPRTVNYHKDCQVFEFKPGDIRADWTNLQDVEVIVYHFWTDSHLPIASVDVRSNLVTFAHKAGKTFTDDFTEEGARYIVENVYEGLDSPGEWYLNRKTGVLTYYAKPGENLESADVVAPRLSQFIRVEGDPRNRRMVEHLRFHGLQFEYTSFQLPPGNSNDQQGSASVSAAITFTGAQNVRFENCAFRNLGTWAIELRKGCSGNAFIGNQIISVAAGGFRVNGGTEEDHPLERTGHNIITDNRVGPYGQMYPSAVGVLLMHTEGNLVAHNEIHNGYYTGISAGWVWGYRRSVSQGNRIEFNHIHDIGKGLLSDMGGIYTLGVSPGTTIRNNRIHDVDANRYGGWGIYHDEGSTHLLVESNLVYRTKFAPFNIHFAKEVTVRNNIFALGRLQQLSRDRNEPHKSVFLENNIVYWRTGELFDKNWKDAPYSFYNHPKNTAGTVNLTNTFDCNWNLYFNPGKALDEVSFAGATWNQWQARGKDTHSFYADPLFADPENGDFSLKPESPAWALGFKPIDLSKVGPRN